LSALRTYLFGFFTFCYLLAVSGIPVYLHYCGGELEEISYLTKTDSCCGEEESEDSDCCHNESLVLRNTVEARVAPEARLAEQTSQLLSVLFFSSSVAIPYCQQHLTEKIAHSPPILQQAQIVSTRCLRI